MKKITRNTFIVMIVMCFLLMSFSTVFAFWAPKPITWDDPVATGKNGAVFSSEVISPSALPGVESLTTGMVVPVGFKHELQFGGNGIQISSLGTGEKVQICFDFPTYSYKWNGKIAMWDGAKWVFMPTSITQYDEIPSASACTTGAANGYYALLIWYYGPWEQIIPIRRPPA